MAGIILVDEIRDTAGTGSPSFPNGLDVAELVDPIGSEGEVLTVQADGSILAAEASGGGGWPMPVAVADVEDAQVIGDAVVAALGLVGRFVNDYYSTCGIYFMSPELDCVASISGSFASSDWVFEWGENYAWSQSAGAGTVYVVNFSTGKDGGFVP